MRTRWRSLGRCLLVVALLAGCGRTDVKVVDVNDLLRIELGKIVPVSAFLRKPADIICVLYGLLVSDERAR